MLKTIIVDDEKHCIETLQWELKNHSETIEVIKTCSNGQSALDSIAMYEPDLVFMDIDMPDMNGFDVLNRLDSVNFDVIFVTAFDEYAIQAIKVSALDYLLKPIDKDDLSNAIDKCLKQRAENQYRKTYDKRLSMLINHMGIDEKRIKQVALPSSNGYEFIPPEEIMYCISESNYTRVYLLGGAKILISKTLKDIESLLPNSQFFRAHHSHLVNLDHIRKYERGDGGILTMSDGKQIMVSRSRKIQLMDIMSKS